ncbi:type I-C CRISPR-associated protein Cas8c/Csd1 [Methylococcus capsulatus]|uniref:type I-C CRISPR-associated protein Cas8c/Csd1 n=1 Tax=Methylococcus capsulatus TaxID=414 RepID=UPI001C528F3A|nr:type I-C CRISPR-associated protein Cas8c/Csd1 [Methylococcus capsulatus]QXP90096.1 type I-C CRISPR-associated protein Cas8c/Csd1 [Methylococcus capsulatus]
MILQALYEYYGRKPELPALGFEEKEIPFLIVVDEQGRFVQLEDTREGEGKKKVPKRFFVPQAVKRTAGIAANVLWDNSSYVLGMDAKGKPERLKEQTRAFEQAIRDLGLEDDAGVSAVLAFLDSKEEKAKALEAASSWPEILEKGANLAFRLQSRSELVCQHEMVRTALTRRLTEANADPAVCLVSGEEDAPERLHPPIKGVWGGQPTGANIVSFNLDAFNSWGKSQGDNAPVGKRAAFAYTTALNHLLAKDSKQRLQVGDASTVFWAAQANPLEDLLADLFSEPSKDDPDRNTRAVESLYKAPHTGASVFDDDGTQFYVLGLAPNAARIAVRYWHVATVRELARHLKQHFRDLEIIHAPNEKPYLPLEQLLKSTAPATSKHPFGDPEKITPNLAGEFMKSILAGTPYPQTLLQAAIRRIRADQKITYPRAALVKACLNRQTRYSNPDNVKELTVALDDTQTNIGYRLGRLFAVLEKIQEEANPGINATIRDRYYGAASSTPVAVFQTLMRLKNHHLAKLENRGRAVNLERLIGEIVDGIDAFPPILSLADQGYFTIGYYHQRQALFTKTDRS